MIIIIDNYDSFTYNLFQYFQQMTEEVRVYPNDQLTIHDVEQHDPDLIVLSPGPGNPDETGISREVLTAFSGRVPILGICLGHQLIVDFFGGSVEKGEKPMQGKVTRVTHDGNTIFSGLPETLRVTRYHSLITPEEKMAACLEVSARSEEGVVMAVRHQSLPIEGIQFHPESIMTEYGYDMLEKAYEAALLYRKEKVR
ncbi:aminodeoxychorismate/anthranilate synthase component II [Halobacillus litoralis]|uniref:anthranilate synthase component II n=1 Tax=Halobacillus litoralis TaxID=45668 RepID=UPI001CD6766C|nr:aminodeoxychorismate/anthranilate synthase component II [Halobacillus litoralis]MCA0971215.1 aminodeoxychorismate/anthranilate synthase component II [Halobacillus litoralis]